MTEYESLSKNGLLLSESDFNLIRDSLISGAREAKKYLNVADDSWPRFIFANEVDVLGYSSQHDAISISLTRLNQTDRDSTKLEYKDQLLVFAPDVFYIIVKYTYWLKLLGIEATIHRYQRISSPFLKKQFPEKPPPSPKKLLLSDFEVEARQFTDTVIMQLGENPIWKNFDAYLSKNYPQYYDKSIEELEKLPKIIFPITFEMEYYAI